MKMRFPILIDGLRMRIPNCGRVILACITLHNFLLNTGSGYFEAEAEDQDEEEPEGQDEAEASEENDTVRSALCQLV